MGVVKALIIVGTRPEAIKMAPVVQLMKKDPRFQCQLCITAQHREMLDQVLRIFDIVPDYDLNVMSPGQSVESIIEKTVPLIGDILKKFKPDVVLVHGDTTTTLCGALSAFLNKVPVGHVEAGLRSGNLMAPWPEEGNRRMVSSISSIDFAPTENAKTNLLNEGKNHKDVHVTGNTVIDALLVQRDKLQIENLQKYFSTLVQQFDQNKRYILVTAHRRENFGVGIRNICESVQRITELRDDVEFIWPVHPNPLIKNIVHKVLGLNKRVHLIPPQDYNEFLYLMTISYLILSDSGGVQEEAPSLHKPVLLMRNETERPEAVNAGCVSLVGSSPQKIINETLKLLDDCNIYSDMANSTNPFGDGLASIKIANCLFEKMKGKP